jgi:hypothetical protein
MKRRMTVVALASVVGACVSVVPVVGARAQTSSQSEIDQLKATIDQLNERVKALEARAAAAAPVTPPNAPAVGAPAVYAPLSAPGPAITASDFSPPTASAAQAPAPAALAQTAPAEQPPSPVRTAIPSVQTPPPTSQGLEAESTHALERALVVTGNLLLPENIFEIQPSLGYTYAEALSTIVTGPGTIATQRIRTDEATATLTFRYGLPWASQFDLSLPSPTWVRTGSNAGPTIQNGESTGGLTDMTIGLDHQFLNDGPWRPAAIGFITWKPPTSTGNILNFFAPSTTSVRPFNRAIGYELLEAGFNLVKRKDPLVFTAGYSHDFVFNGERNGFSVDPGDTNNFSAGAILAVTPDVSLRAGLAATYQDPAKINNIKVLGSDDVIASFTGGASITLTSQILLDVAVTTGLTPEANNFGVAVSLPIRF